MMALEGYLRDLRDTRSTGAAVKETSYYTALSNLLNEIGNGLKPKVRCVLQLANRGAGSPDGGLFTPDQLKNANEGAPLLGQSPSRGVIEVKGTGDDAWVTAGGPQVTKYWNKYRQVLVTNYRDFVLVGQDSDGKPVKLETYRLAASEAEFWAQAAHPKTFAQKHESTLIEYLRRVMLYAAPLAAPKDLAWFMASYARTAKVRVEHAGLPALATVRKALEDSLGLQFTGEKGDHFFRSTLVQTLFYGVFSAWVLWSKGRAASSKERFEWRTSAWHLRVPMIRSLFEQVATPAKLGSLGLVEVLDWTEATLHRVDRASFFQQFEEGEAVQYFYEPFLEAFDPELRKDLGVWFTPPEIVKYMVARVDTVLREELGLADGLADPNVYILDPCCGTGSYLVEVLRKIAATLKDKGGDALLGSDLKKAAMKRVFGFEILPAPFVVAHLQLGLLLQNLGASLDGSGKERAGVYLTNALTGWEPLDPEKEKAFQAMLMGFPELLEERDSARQVKQQVPILVILGNPPYNAFAGVSPEEEQGLVEPYKKGLVKGWGIRKFNLDDLYVRFFRLAERRIAEQTGRGVVSYISNFSYVGDPSFVVMRQRFLGGFDRLWFDNMNGDSRETGKRTPDGKPDPSVFSTEYNKAGIRVGTVVSVLVRKNERDPEPLIRYREFWGITKRADLLNSLHAADFHSKYRPAHPAKANRYSFRPGSLSDQYPTWARVVDLSAAEPNNGPIERRGNSLIRFPDEKGHFALLGKYLDPSVSDEAVRASEPRFMKSSGEFVAEKARAALKGKVKYDAANIVRYPFKPFDVRLAYLDSNIAPLFSRPSPELLAQSFQGNSFLVVRETGDKDSNSPPFYFSSLICDYHCLVVEAKHIPVFLRGSGLTAGNKHPDQGELLKEAGPTQFTKANLSSTARQYLADLGIRDPATDPKVAALLWMHVLAIGYSPAYLEDNRDGLRQDWPHVPLPKTRELFEASAGLGEQVAGLLNTEQDVPTVTAGSIGPGLRVIASVAKEGGGQLQHGDLALTVGWGHRGQNDVVMPGTGKLVERDHTPDERDAMGKGAEGLGLSVDEAFTRLGERTCDVYLNDVAYWCNVPRGVWDFVIGGYQIIKKWLSYREREVLSRALTAEEVREVTNMARRIATILLLQPALDANYLRCKQNTYTWPK